MAQSSMSTKLFILGKLKKKKNWP